MARGHLRRRHPRRAASLCRVRVATYSGYAWRRLVVVMWWPATTTVRSSFGKWGLSDMTVRILSRALVAALLVLGCQRPAADDANAASPNAEPLHTAMQQLTSVIVYDIFSPPQASRAYAYAG